MKEWTELDSPWERLTWARERWQKAIGVKRSRAHAAESLGMSESTYSQYERPPGSSRSAKLDNDYAEKFGRKFKANWVWLLTGAGSPDIDNSDHNPENDFKTPITSMVKGVVSAAREGAEYPQARMIPIVGEVQAGAFMHVNDFEFVDENTTLVAFYDQKYARNTVRALKIIGNSVNLVYPHGTTVYIAPASEVGLRDQQFVVARQFDQTGKAETTVKQLVRNGDQLELWPRSIDPRYQEPIIIPARDETSQDGLHIEWVVIGAYQPAPEGEGSLIFI